MKVFSIVKLSFREHVSDQAAHEPYRSGKEQKHPLDFVELWSAHKEGDGDGQRYDGSYETRDPVNNVGEQLHDERPRKEPQSVGG
jgi:hypothetical protein